MKKIKKARVITGETPAMNCIQYLLSLSNVLIDAASLANDDYLDGRLVSLDEALHAVWRPLVDTGDYASMRGVLERTLARLSEDQAHADYTRIPAEQQKSYPVTEPHEFDPSRALAIVAEMATVVSLSMHEGWFDADKMVRRPYDLDHAVIDALREATLWHYQLEMEPFDLVFDAVRIAVGNLLDEREGRMPK